MSGGAELRLASASLQGERSYQQDAVETRELSDGRTLVALADGMGGHASGDVASRLTMETLVGALEEGRDLEEAFGRANERVREEVREAGEKMGATLVAVLVEGDSYRLANVGDSRAYRVTAGGIEQLSEDHSFGNEAVARGADPDDVANSPYRDALTRAVGIDDELEVDLFGPFEAGAGTVLLLCSDGLNKTLPDADIRRILLSCGDLDEAAETLPSRALQRGSDDNITVALASFGDLPEPDDDGGGERSVPDTAVTPVEEAPDEEPDGEPSGSRGRGGLWLAVLVLAALAALAGWLLLG